MKKLIAIGICTASFAFAAAFAFARNAPAPPTFTPSGVPAALGAADSQALARAGVERGLRVLGERAGLRFYSADSSAGTNRCFALGDARIDGGLLFAGCQSAENPFSTSRLVDLSPRQGDDAADPAAATVFVTRLVGFASDGVARVGIVDASGSMIASTPVVNNTYASGSFAHVPAKAIVAIDRGGRTVGSISLTQ